MRMIIDQAQTFAAVIFMGCTPKTQFKDGKPTGQDTTAEGTPKWQVQVSLAPREVPGAKIQERPELVNVNVAAADDPGTGLMPGMPVVFESLALGTVKGSVFYQASGLKAQGANPSKAKADA